jgi:hypothetical protein
MKSARAFKIDDLPQLQELVGEHAETLETGLKVLDSRVLLGGATIDLVAVDAGGSLVLMALGFLGDDEMLIRALEAYSWALEYPDAVRRLYPAVRLSASDPPRIVFVAERMPDAFLRKVKHLRLPNVACVEFHFGVSFATVAGPRGGEDLAPLPEPTGPARGETAAGLLEGVRIADTIKPSAQWRRSLAAAPAEPDERRVATVREYLQREFPAAVIYDFYDHDRSARVFHLQDNQGSVVHTAAVAAEVFDEHTDRELRSYLDRHKFGRVLRQAGQAAVSVTRSGLKIERR